MIVLDNRNYLIKISIKGWMDGCNILIKKVSFGFLRVFVRLVPLYSWQKESMGLKYQSIVIAI